MVALKVITIFALAVGSVGALSQTSVLPNFQKAETRSEQKPSVGVMAGIANPENGGYPTVANFGAQYAYQPYIPITAAAEISGTSFPSQGTAAGLTRVQLFAKGAYNFGGSTVLIKNSYAGFGVGPVFDNYKGKTDVEFGFAPMIGFDIPLSNESEPHVSLGANANYLFVGGAKAEIFALDGVAKYWF